MKRRKAERDCRRWHANRHSWKLGRAEVWGGTAPALSHWPAGLGPPPCKGRSLAAPWAPNRWEEIPPAQPEPAGPVPHGEEDSGPA